MRNHRFVLLAVATSLLLTACAPEVGHQVEVVSLATEEGTLPKAEAFYLLPDTMAMAEAVSIGQLRSTAAHGKKSTLNQLYLALRKQANALGANAYKVQGFCDDPRPCTITADLFFLSEAMIDSLLPPLPADAIYVIGDLEVNGKPRGFKIDGEPQEVPPLRYVERMNHRAEMELSVGGMLGAAVTIPGGHGGPPRFFTLSGFGVGPAPPRGGLGLSFNSGRIYPVSWGLGHFLVTVLPADRP